VRVGWLTIHRFARREQDTTIRAENFLGKVGVQGRLRARIRGYLCVDVVAPAAVMIFTI
jgi:hypothetical protein